jgi:hypothetical protein
MKVLVTRPKQWDGTKIGDVEFIHVPVFGDSPMLRGGAPMGDSVGGCAMDSGLSKLIQYFEEYKPDAFLFWAMYGWSDMDKHQVASVQAALATCRQIAPKCVFFYGNGNQATTISDGQPDFNVKAFETIIDVILDNTRDKMIHSIYTRRGLHVDVLYTFGFDPGAIEDYSGKSFEHDAFFGGSYTGQSRFPNSAFRHRLLTTLASEFDLLVRGRGRWPAPVKHKPYVHAMDYPAEIGRCGVAIGCYHADLERYYTKRTIYSLASGRPYLVRYIPGMQIDFKDGVELVVYKTVEQARSSLRVILSDPVWAKEVGSAGRKVAVARHSWLARANDMYAILRRWV